MIDLTISLGGGSQKTSNHEGTGDLRWEGLEEGNASCQINPHISIGVSAVDLIQNYFMQFVQSAFQNNNRAVRPLNPPRRRRRRSAKFCRKVRGRQQKDSTTFAIWKEHTSVNPQQVISSPPLPATTSLSHHKTRDQLIFENVYERREKDKAKVKVAKEKAKKERQCSLKNKQASKVHDLCATLRAARSQLRESKKEGVEQGKKIESMAKELSVMNQPPTLSMVLSANAIHGIIRHRFSQQHPPSPSLAEESTLPILSGVHFACGSYVYFSISTSNKLIVLFTCLSPLLPYP